MVLYPHTLAGDKQSHSPQHPLQTPPRGQPRASAPKKSFTLHIRGTEMRVLKNGIIHIQQARIVYGNWHFEVDSMRWEKQTHTLKSQGKVVFYNEIIQGHATQLVMNTQNGKAVLQNPVVEATATPDTPQANLPSSSKTHSPSQAQKEETAADVDIAQATPTQPPLHFSAKTLFLTQATPNQATPAPVVLHQGSVAWQQWSILGNTIMLWLDSKKIQAQGDVRLTSTVLRAKAQSLQGSLAQQRMVLKKAHVTRLDTGLQVTSERAVLHRDGETATLYTCTITVCPAPPLWQIKADKLHFAPNETGVATSAVLKIYDTKVLWVPAFAFPVGKARRSGFLPPLFSRNTSSDARLNLGTRLQLPFFWAPHQSLDVTLTPELTEKRYPSLHMEHRYTYRTNQWGLLQGWVGQAQPADSQNTSLSQDEDIQRYWFDHGHRQYWADGSALHLQARHASDGLVRRQYHQKTDRPWRSYRLGLSQQWQTLDAALLAEHRVEYNAETLADNTQRHTTFRGSVRQGPVLRQWGGWDVDLGNTAHVFLSLQSAAWQFNSPSFPSGQAAWLQPGVALPFRLGPFEIRPSFEQRLVAFGQLTQPGGILPPQQFQQAQANTTVLLPLLNISESAEGDLVVKRLIPTLQLQWRQNVSPFSHARVVGEQPVVRRLTLGVSHYWQQQTNPLGTLVENTSLHLMQPYDALRRADAPPPKTPPIAINPLTKRGQPWQPTVARFRWQRTNWQGSHQVHHHHQQNRVHRWQTNLRYNSLRWGWSLGATQNKFDYLASEGTVQAKAATVTTTMRLRMSPRQQWSLNTQVDLQSASQRPLGKHLQAANLSWKYRGVCHQVGLAVQRYVVAATDSNQTTTYRNDTKFTLSFSLNAKAYTPTLEQEAQFTSSILQGNPGSACRG